MEVGSGRDEVGGVRMAPPTLPLTITTASIAVPKLEVRGYHGPHLPLPHMKNKKESYGETTERIVGAQAPHLDSDHTLHCEDGSCF